MRYRLLGNSGLRVSEAALGTMTFGDDWGWGAAKDEARKVYDVFREAGGNFIDTANIYTNGTSERFPCCRTISQALTSRSQREQLKTLDEASRIELGFPQILYANEMVLAIAYAGVREQILA
jgi:aryl-alcohol dehydrogenase-like predicted oxidoreductase